MSTFRGLTLFLTGLIALVLLPASPAQAVPHTRDFPLEDCTWTTRRPHNRFFSLAPGYRLELMGEEDGEEIEVQITVLRKKETIRFRTPGGTKLTVQARVVEEREWVDGELVEVSRNWFARCEETSDVYYFGEEVDIYEDGELVSNEGAWRAGENGAQPGIIMPGSFLLGSKYYQEYAPDDDALDRAKHVLMGEEMNVPAGSFTDCVVVKETTPLEPGFGLKVYCPGIGLVMDEVLALTSYGRAPANGN